MPTFEFTTEGDFVPGETTEWDVFSLLPGGDYEQPEYLATLYSAYQKTIRVELDNCGSGAFAINRTSPECTEAILAQGNLVKVRIPEIHDDYIFAFFLETGDFTLISSQEEGGEMLTFGGRGILSYLEYARAASESFIDGGMSPIAGVWRAYLAGTGAAPGQIVRRMIEEFQHVDRVYPVAASHPLPHLTIDFDYDDDSDADPWDTTDATDEFSYQVGEDGLAILLRLLETDTIRVQMSPDFLLQAYNVDNFGRDLTGADFGADIVRFEKGVNIATELRRELAVDRVGTHVLVQGEADKYGGAVLADAADRVTKEVFVQAFGTGTTALNAIGAVDLQSRLHVSDTIMFPIANRRTADVVLSDPVSVGAPLGPLAVDGFYLPGPEGTLGDFWVGDTVRVHTGSGPFDYAEVDAVVNAITISRDDNHELIVIPELVSPIPTPVVPIEQYDSQANYQSETLFVWPEGIPGPGNLLVGIIASRDTPGAVDTSTVPSSYPDSFNTSLPIAGTDWTNIDGFDVHAAGDGLAMAWRDSTLDDTAYTRWASSPSATFGRPRMSQMEIAGLSGAPTVVETSDNQSTGGTTYTSPSITVPEAGYIIAGFHFATSGPHDIFGWGGFSIGAAAPAVNLGYGWMEGNFGGFSWFGYRYVSGSGTYSITLGRQGDANDATDPWGWIVGFWPGPESPAYPATP